MSVPLKEEIRSSAMRAGFDLVAFSSADPDENSRDRYQKWKESGRAAGLQYMVRDNPRRWVPQDLLPEARSVVSLAVLFGSDGGALPSKRGFGKVARYAWGKDYHEVIRDRLEGWAADLGKSLGTGFKYKVLVDSGPFLERAFAEKAGLGFFGKNTLLISRKLGSFLFLSEVLLSIDLDPDVLSAPDPFYEKDPCGACKECLVKCPTDALAEKRVLDANRCISYWTIENRGAIPEHMLSGIGDWIFGCDICQEVCPYNGVGRQTRWPEFGPEAGVGPYLPLLEVLALISDEEFKERFKGTPILRAKRAGLLRNACVVAANQGLEEAMPLLEKLSGEEPFLGEQARRAAQAIREKAKV